MSSAVGAVGPVSRVNRERQDYSMQAKEGWYRFLSKNAKAGDCYQFIINGATKVPDPASHFQPDGVDQASLLVDPNSFHWTDENWRGRPWEEAVIYELHTGCFSPSGNFKGVEEKLDYLATLGVTAIELMPVAAFKGQRGWGYDGVLPYAPQSTYGKPGDLKQLINAAHRKGLMVFLDVVYNHFGPAGNYLHQYADHFFTDKYQTPWGSAINVEDSASVRDFFIDNALYWLNEFHFDGLRLDAVHAIRDNSAKHFLYDLAEKVRAQMPTGRHIHLILENDKNEARYLDYSGAKPKDFNAQWNDDIHHCFHVLLSDEQGGYYSDYKTDTLKRLGRCLAEGFAFQGEPSPHRHNEKRGEKSEHLPPQAFTHSCRTMTKLVTAPLVTG